MTATIFSAILIYFFGLFVMGKTGQYQRKKQECPEHDLLDCYDCIEIYGFYVANYQEGEACEEHEDKKTFDFTTTTKDCIKCGTIDKRFVSLHLH